jgi:hypothetical protein
MWRRLKGGRPIWSKKEKLLKLKIKKRRKKHKGVPPSQIIAFFGNKVLYLNR